MDEGATHLGVSSALRQGSLVPGATLVSGTYKIEKRLGAGGMGEVWRAQNTVTGAPCAIKVVRQELVVDDLAVALFKREAEALKNIRDSAVVGYEGAFRDEHGCVFLVMQYVDGPSLAERMRERPLSVDEVTRLTQRLARGLGAAHAVGVFHRDLSPDNVLLPNGRLEDAVIIDFGIAKRVGGGGPTLYGGWAQGFTGKFAYASPEQAGAIDAPVDQRSDVYSLGLVLAAAARGRPLPMGDDPLSAIAARRKRPDLSSLPKPLQELLAPLLAPDPRERPQSMQDVLKMVAPPPPPPTRWLGWVGVGTIGGAVAVAAWLMLSEPAPPPPLPVPEGADPSEGAAPQVPSSAEAPVEPPVGDDPPEPSVDPPVPQFDPEVVRVDVDRLLAALPCARLQANVSTGGTVALSGEISSRQRADRLLAEIRAVPGVAAIEDSLVVVPSPHCEAATEIAELVGPSYEHAPVIALSRPSGVYSAAQDVFRASIMAPPGLGGYLYVDYFDHTGQVYHLLPEELTPDNRISPGGTLGIGEEPSAAGPKDRVWHLSEPFGPGRIVAILSERPLYDGLRPIGEDARSYLGFLRTALESARSEGRVAMSEVSIETTP